MNLIAAVDIGGTKIAVGLVDSWGQIIDREVCPTDRERDFNFGLQSIQSLLARCLQRHPEVRLVGVGIGCTGPVDSDTGVLGPNSFLPYWEGVHTISRFEEAFGLPVAIENDADAAALGEAAWGAGRGAQRFLYVTVSTGIGCGIVLNNHLYRGAGGAHPEIGHMVIDPARGPLCYCGAQGCWESLAAGPAMAAWYADERARRGLSDPDTASNAREICFRAERGDRLAFEAVRREGEYLGLGLANLVTLFVPDVIALGGGVMESWPLFEGQIREVIERSCGLVPFERTELRRASLGERTGLIGAARVWFHRYSEGENIDWNSSISA